MSPPRFTHKRITASDFKAELDRQNLSLPAFTRIWCQNLSKTKRWANGQEDIPTWVPIALTLMTLPDAMRTARTAAAAMIERDTLNPHLGAFPYQRVREMPLDEVEIDADDPKGDGENIEWLTPEQHRAKHDRGGYG